MVAAVPSNQDEITFEQFSEEWLLEFEQGELSPFEKGQRFAFKLVTQWLGVTEDDEDLILCDGTGDGGIDIAYLRRSEIGDTEQDEQSVEGDTWYLIQSKYGTAFQGADTIVGEGRKVIATLTGNNDRLSEHTTQLVGRLQNFVTGASDRDKLVLVFATIMPMREDDRRALNDIRTLGNQEFPGIFDVEDISLQTIRDAGGPIHSPAISLSIQGEFVEPSAGLRVGTIPLTTLYQFLKGYRDKTGNLDQLYEKNVRQFLGGRRKINKGIAQTLETEPEMFGLYNNGITIVVSDFWARTDGSLVLYDPYVVNGCQTTKSIWNVLQQKLDPGGTGQSEALEQWRVKAERGVVVTKIVKGSDVALTKITKFTNSQNAVREQDLLALDTSFKTWEENMSSHYDMFLEIQRGGWDTRKAFQKSHPNERQFVESANAFDLIKVYGAGWLRWPGQAYGRSAPFLPGGSIFKQVTETEPITVDDLYASYRLQQSAEKFKFGRGAGVQPSRRLTRFLYYFVVMDLLRDVLIRTNQDYSSQGLTTAFRCLLQDCNQDTLQLLLDASIDVVDEYLNQESDDSVFKEREFEGNLNGWLKSERLGRNEDATHRLNSLMATHKAIFGRARRGQSSPRDMVTQALASYSA